MILTHNLTDALAARRVDVARNVLPISQYTDRSKVNTAGGLTGVETLVTGLLLSGSRTQDEPWSTPLIHNSWKVACAAADATSEAATASLTNIFAIRQMCE